MARFTRIAGFGLLLIGAGLSALHAQEDGAEPPRAAYSIERSPTLKLDIDGRLDEDAWKQALQVELAYEWQPGDNVAPPVRTVVYVLFDQFQLYVGFRAEDPDPSKIRAHLMDRDEVRTFVQDDHVVFQVDTFDDQRRAFQFRVNPYGIQADAIFSQSAGGEDFSWDVIWRSAGHIGNDGWSVEVAIPFHQLRFPKTDGPQTWGFDFGRSYPRTVRHRFSANPFPRGNNCILCYVPRVTGFEGFEPGLNLEVAPTVTVARTDSAPSPGADLVDGDEDLEGGLSVRWSPTTSLTLNATVNPDFSQVEADAAQLEINERFALQFPEKRPFFLEGADFFRTPIETLFTRSISDPEWGVKLTGKVGDSALGVLVAEDSINNFGIPTNNGTQRYSLEQNVFNSVLRWRRDVGTASALGIMLTNREGEDGYFNRVATVDGDFRLNENSRLQLQAAGSDTRYPLEFAQQVGQETDAFGGHAFQGIYFYGDRDWAGSLGYRTFSPDFRADAGFIPRTDFKTWRGDVFRTFWGEDEDWYNYYQFGLLALRTEDHEGRLTDQRVAFAGSLEGPLQSEIDFQIANQDQISGDNFFEDLLQYNVELEMQPTGNFRFEIEFDWGDGVDFSFHRAAETLRVRPEIELKIGDHLNAQIDYLRFDLDVEGGRFFTAEVGQMQIVYQFDARTFVRGIFQYRTLDLVPEQTPIEGIPDYESLFSQLLFSYKINPQAVAFLGYSEEREALGPASLELADRSFFFKLGYAWIR